jgi:hypothetical protein
MLNLSNPKAGTQLTISILYSGCCVVQMEQVAWRYLRACKRGIHVFRDALRYTEESSSTKDTVILIAGYPETVVFEKLDR